MRPSYIGRTTRLARPSVRPSVPYRLVTRKQKKCRKIKIGVDAPQGTRANENVKGHGHRMSKTTENWRRVYVRTADEAQADRTPTAN